MEEEVREPLPRHLLPVDLDPVMGSDDGVEPARLAVDPDPSGLDQLVGAPPRGDAGAGEERV